MHCDEQHAVVPHEEREARREESFSHPVGPFAVSFSNANEFTAIIEQDEGWFIAYSPEVPGSTGQGRTKDEAIQSLKQAIELILLDRRAGG